VPAASVPTVVAVPDSETASEGFEESLVTVRVPDGEPALTGANTTLKDLLAPAAKVNGTATPLTLYPVPLAEICETVTVVPPELVTVSDRVWLWPTVTFPKLRGEVVAVSAPAAAAVPDSETMSEGFEASLVAVKVPDSVPALIGAKTTLKDLLAPAAKVNGTATPLTLYPVPLAESCETVTVVPPELVRVSDRDLLCPTVTLPKLRGEVPAARVPAVGAVPVSATVRVGFGASLVTVKVPDGVPALAGAKVTLKDLLAPAVKVNGTATLTL